MPIIERSGRFRAQPYDWEIMRNPSTGSVGLIIYFNILAQRYNDEENNEQWEGRWATEWKGYTVSGYFNLVTKQGKANTVTIEQLASGMNYRFFSFADLESGPPTEEVVELDVIPNPRPRGDDFTIENMYPIGGRKMADTSELDALFGAELRAAASDAVGNAPPAQGSTPGAPPFGRPGMAGSNPAPGQTGESPGVARPDAEAAPPAVGSGPSPAVAPPPGAGAAPGNPGPAGDEPPAWIDDLPF